MHCKGNTNSAEDAENNSNTDYRGGVNTGAVRTKRIQSGRYQSCRRPGLRGVRWLA